MEKAEECPELRMRMEPRKMQERLAAHPDALVVIDEFHQEMHRFGVAGLRRVIPRRTRAAHISRFTPVTGRRRVGTIDGGSAGPKLPADRN